MAADIKIGIIGAGAIGSVHAKAFTATGEAKLQAVCDIDAKKVERMADEYDISERFETYQDLLKSDVDAVLVCVGNALHRDVAVDACRAGKHVLLEKPMALNATQAEEILNEADKAGVTLQVGMVNRQKAEPQLLRRYVEDGMLGEIYHMRAVMIRRRGIPGLGGWFTTKALSGGGPMIDLGVHWFDLAMWLSGHWNPTHCSAKTYAKFGSAMDRYRYVGMWAGPPKLDGTFDVEDYSTGFVRFGEKATMSFEIAWAANAESESFVEILGDKGGARVFSGKPLQIFTEHADGLADIVPQFDTKVAHFDVQAKKFLAACRGEAAPAVTGQEGLTVMKLIDAIYASSEANREVDIS